ncbi:RNA-directed DNA polymerase from mobile element jockey, partial [Paramuricea clavata]
KDEVTPRVRTKPKNSRSKAEKFVLHERKCKEMRISFTKSEKDFPPVTINNAPVEVVPHVKILGLNVSDNLKWNYYVSELVKKSSKRLYFLTQLKRAKVGCLEL